MPDYSFQPPCIERIMEARKRGVRRLVATAPTGSGKGEMIVSLVESEIARGGRPIVYTNRRVIRQQLTDRLDKYEVAHGVRAAGIMPRFDLSAQVSSIDTERHRSLNPYHPWDVYDATLVIVDEAHSNKAATAQKLFDQHEQQGAFILGFTATPVGLGFEYDSVNGRRRFYDELMILIRNSELRARGVIVPCDVFAPSEIDMDGVDLNADGDFVRKQVEARFEGVKWAVLSNVVENYRKLNPLLEPSVLFPPGVPESRWFAQHLTEKGIPTVHIDAETRDGDREQAFVDHKSGKIKVIASYGVLQEGWDAPWARHAILCRPVAAVTTYVQLIGRVLRSAPNKERATLQDHVGAWHRPGLGSPNQDREWKLEDTNGSISKTEKQNFENREANEDKEPARCPKCSRVLKARASDGYQCCCGYTFKKSVRMVIQLDGNLERKLGSVTKRKAPKDDTYFFRAAIFAGVQSGRTVGQVFGIAMNSKRNTTGDTEAVIDRTKCGIFIPERDDPRWHKMAKDVYPWAMKKNNAVGAAS